MDRRVCAVRPTVTLLRMPHPSAPSRMPGRLRAVAALAAALAVLVPTAAPGSAGSPVPALPVRTYRPALSVLPAQHEDDSLRDQYDEVLGQEAALIGRVQSAQAERSRLTGELERLEADLQAKNVELFQAQAELDDAEFLAMIYAQAVIDARQKVEVASERLRKQIVATYVNGGADASVLEALLKARNGE